MLTYDSGHVVPDCEGSGGFIYGLKAAGSELMGENMETFFLLTVGNAARSRC